MYSTDVLGVIIFLLGILTPFCVAAILALLLRKRGEFRDWTYRADRWWHATNDEEGGYTAFKL